MIKRNYLVFEKQHMYVECNYCYHTTSDEQEIVFLNHIVQLTSKEARLLEESKYYVMEVLEKEDVTKALNVAIHEAKEQALREEERAAKAKIAAEKRKKTREANKRKKELAELEKLKKKYNK